MAAITYDSPELQQIFIQEQGIAFPLVSDIDAITMLSLGILNTEYSAGDDNYGVPWPGIFVLNPNQQIVGKVFLEGYSTRVDASAVLEYAITKLNPVPPSP